MDHNTFLEKLSRLASWKLGDLTRPGRGPKKPVDNDTYPVELVEVYDRPSACEHCGKICDNKPGVDIQRREGSWIRKCLDCKLYQHPDTGEYTMRGVEISAHLRKRSRR